MRRHFIVLILLGACLLLLSGCSDFVDQDQPAIAPKLQVRLESGHTVGQTFVARHGGLDGLRLWLTPEPGSQGEVQLHLREDAQATQDLIASTMPLASIPPSGPTYFALPTLTNSKGRYLYAFLELEGKGALRVDAAPGDTYRDGALYQDHSPLPDAQLAFGLTYALVPSLLNLANEAVQGLGLLAVAALLYLLPGAVLITWLYRAAKLSWAETLGLAVGVNLAFYPLWLLWTGLVGVHLGPMNVWLPPALGALGLIFLSRRPGRGRGAGRVPRFAAAVHDWAQSDRLWPDLALLVVIALMFGVRLLVASNLEGPSWGDSVQHAAIAQLFIDHGGLFSSWVPYAPYQTLSVHYGFSADAALLSWITGMSASRATLWAGQLINGLSALALYPLALRLSKGKHWAGTGAVLAAGLLSTMPAFYANWGRFAQLAAQAILPVALWFLCYVLERSRFTLRSLVLAGFLVGGMALSNYRVPFYYAAFVVPWLVGYGLPVLENRSPHVGRALRAARAHRSPCYRASIMPWVPNVLGASIGAKASIGVAHGSTLQAVLADYQTWHSLNVYVPVILQAVCLAGLIWALLWRKWQIASVGLWIVCLASLVAGGLVHLPGTTMLDNFATLIMLYIPVSLLVGWLIGELVSLADARYGRPVLWAAALAVALLGSWGAARQVSVVQPDFIMVTRPDTRAMDWIRSNTPAEARFLVEGFRVRWGHDSRWFRCRVVDSLVGRPGQHHAPTIRLGGRGADSEGLYGAGR